MDKSLANKKNLIYSLVIVFIIMGVITYQLVKDLQEKTMISNALLVAEIIIGQRKVIRNVYNREVVSKLKSDGYGGQVNFRDHPGFVPVPALFLRFLSQESDLIIKNIKYKSVSKWNMGPYSLGDDPFLIWGWQQLEIQNQNVRDEPYDWQPVWRIEYTDKGPVVRYLDAVPASSASCVSCHQRHEDSDEIQRLRIDTGVSPHNFRQHHLLGALNIDIPLYENRHLTDEHLREFILWVAVIMVCSFLTIFWFSTHSLRQLKDLLVLTQQSHHDQLTDLMNRRGFERSLQQHIRLLDTDEKTFSLCVFDLDGFKQINDNYGHQAGDALLREIANVMHQTFRENDVLIRLGGDEFCIILAGCDINNANMICHKLLDNIHAIALEWNDAVLTIGASIGVYECCDSKQDADEIFEKADSASYLAKKQGKNQVVIAS